MTGISSQIDKHFFCYFVLCAKEMILKNLPTSHYLMCEILALLIFIFNCLLKIHGCMIYYFTYSGAVQVFEAHHRKQREQS